MHQSLRRFTRAVCTLVDGSTVILSRRALTVQPSGWSAPGGSLQLSPQSVGTPFTPAFAAAFWLET